MSTQRTLGLPRRYQPRHRGERRRDESSNSFPLLIMLMPLILCAFGLGLDTARNTYIRISLQNDLDLATVGGAAVTVYDNQNNLVIDPLPAFAEVERIYATNRNIGPGLSCWGDRSRVPNTTNLVRCWRPLDAPSVSQNGSRLNYSVREQSRNAFLPIVGIPTQEYSLRSEAVVRLNAR